MVIQLIWRFHNLMRIKNQEPHSQIENDETPGPQYPDESDSEEGEADKTSQLHATSITR